MAALLSSEMDGAEREKFFVEHIDDCRRMGIEVLPPERQRGGVDVPGRRARGRSTSAWGRSRGSGSRRSRRSSRRASRGGRSAASTTSSSGSRWRVVSQALRRGADQGRRVRPPGRPAEPVLAVLPRAVQAGQAAQEDRKRGQRSLFDDLRRARARQRHATATATATATPAAARACPTSPSCPTPSGWPRRRRCSASTCRATR